MATKSKFFRVAVEGATATDGRTIERSWIQDIAAGYNRDTYGARVNMEHIRGFSPAAPFNAYGDVLAVKAEEIQIELNGKAEKRLALFAQIDPTEDLVKLTKARQKIYTSIEVAPDFAKTGKAGLVGLAVTDSPASLGTEILQFSASNPAVKAMFDDRKQDPANVLSAAAETSIELEPNPAAAAPSALDTVVAAFAKLLKPEVPEKPDVAPTGDVDAKFAALMTGMETGLKSLATSIDANRTADQAAFASLKGDVEALTKKFDTTDGDRSTRPLSTGGNSEVLTDC